MLTETRTCVQSETHYNKYSSEESKGPTPHIKVITQYPYIKVFSYMLWQSGGRAAMSAEEASLERGARTRPQKEASAEAKPPQWHHLVSKRCVRGAGDEPCAAF